MRESDHFEELGTKYFGIICRVLLCLRYAKYEEEEKRKKSYDSIFLCQTNHHATGKFLSLSLSLNHIDIFAASYIIRLVESNGIFCRRRRQHRASSPSVTASV